MTTPTIYTNEQFEGIVNRLYAMIINSDPDYGLGDTGHAYELAEIKAKEFCQENNIEVKK